MLSRSYEPPTEVQNLLLQREKYETWVEVTWKFDKRQVNIWTRDFTRFVIQLVEQPPISYHHVDVALAWTSNERVL